MRILVYLIVQKITLRIIKRKEMLYAMYDSMEFFFACLSSTLSHQNLRIKSFQFDSGIGCGESQDA